MFQENTNSIRLLNAATVNGYSIVTYQRSLRPSDELDKQIYTNQSQAVIWAIGPLNQRNEVSFHSQYTKGDRFIDFGRPSKWNCPMPDTDAPTMKIVATPQISSRVAQTTTTTTSTTTTQAPSRTAQTAGRRRGESNRGRKPQEPTRLPDVSKDSQDSASQPSRARHQTERRGISRGNERNALRESSTTTTTTTTAPRTVPTPAPVTNRNAWEIPPIQCYEPEDGVFYAQMGPTGGKRGYPAITGSTFTTAFRAYLSSRNESVLGHVGWGISWYINGLLIPEIYLVRGKTYTFVVEGGFDPEIPAKYHPFYITDDPVGGYEYKTPEEKQVGDMRVLFSEGNVLFLMCGLFSERSYFRRRRANQRRSSVSYRSR